MIDIVNKAKFKIDKEIVFQAVFDFFAFFPAKGDLTVVFVDEDEIRELNKKYRKKDKVTDILSFVDDGCEDNYWGELIICPQQIKKQASEFANNFNQELIFMISHGLLHLLGYEDESETGRLEMEKIGGDFMKEYYDKS